MGQLKASVIYLPDMGLSEERLESIINKKLQEKKITSERYVSFESFGTISGRTAVVILHEEDNEGSTTDT